MASTLVIGSIGLDDGVLSGGVCHPDGRIVYVQVATSQLSPAQKTMPVDNLVVALATDLLEGKPSPATVVLDSGPPEPRPASRVGEPVSQARREAIEAVLAASRIPL